MKRAAWSGALTALGTFLAVIAVYNKVRLDWAETALMAGVGILVAGTILGALAIKEGLCGED